MSFNKINSFVYTYIRFIEMVGVLMRIFSFSLVSWMGAESPFMFVWAFNTTDAVILSWCSILKNDNAYTLLNVFWIMVGVVGMFRASALSFLDIKAAGLHFLIQCATLFS
ncbi:MAG: hypothetical protein PHG00_08285 [Methylococcales bacterium]|nr:hypothetical protein [Methylococcales bacterium]